MPTLNRYVFGDIESTGLGNDAGIVEISWVETDGEFNEVAHFSSLINPQKPIQYGAMAVHGISEEMVKNSPTIDEFMKDMNYPLSGPGVVLVAHNAAFDIKFFRHWMNEPNTICTLKAARIVYPDAENHKLGTLRCMLNLDGSAKKAHSAQEDVSVLVQLVKRMCMDADCSLEQLMHIQNIPRVITKMTFGKKHYGKKLEDVPKDYIEWMLREVKNLDPDLRASLLKL